MKIYEKPMAIINKFEVADVIAASMPEDRYAVEYVATEQQAIIEGGAQGVVFAW